MCGHGEQRFLMRDSSGPMARRLPSSDLRWRFPVIRSGLAPRRRSPSRRQLAREGAGPTQVSRAGTVRHRAQRYTGGACRRTRIPCSVPRPPTAADDPRASCGWPLDDPAHRGTAMQIRAGFELIYEFPNPTPMILALNIHHSRTADLLRPDELTTDPAVPVIAYRDKFGNLCSRLIAPPAGCGWRRTRWCATRVTPSRRCPAPGSTRWRTCRRRRCCSCWAAATARPTG